MYYLCHEKTYPKKIMLSHHPIQDEAIEAEIYKVNGAAVEVHKRIGNGFPEKLYGDALEIEFQLRGIPYEREKHLVVPYKGKPLAHDFFVDFLCYGHIIVEIKALDELAPAHFSQVLNYLKALQLKYGLLLNFGEPRINIKRVLR